MFFIWKFTEQREFPPDEEATPAFSLKPEVDATGAVSNTSCKPRSGESLLGVILMGWRLDGVTVSSLRVKLKVLGHGGFRNSFGEGRGARGIDHPSQLP